MESEDMVHDRLAHLHTATRLDSAQHIDEESSFASPRSATTIQSPATDFAQASLLEGDLTDEDITPLVGPQRSSSTLKAEKEKKKRSRVTPDQLVHLERYFAMDRSPTAARRKDISELLGMQERQTQIWFQNRRAKAKLQDGKQNVRLGDHRSHSPPKLSAAVEADLNSLIHEDGPVAIIPCTDLSVGSWRRIASSPTKHDLVAYVSEEKQILTWFIHSAGYGFKMEIPFHTIAETEFKPVSPSAGMATFVLSQSPVFYLEDVNDSKDGNVSRSWKRCSDWTEDRQATKVLRHTLVASTDQLARFLRSLHPTSPVANPPPRPGQAPPHSPSGIPHPPLANLPREAPPYPYAGFRPRAQLERIDTTVARPSYSPAETQFVVEADTRSPPPHSAPPTLFPSQPYLLMDHRSLPSASSYQQPSFYPYQTISQPTSAMSSYSDSVDLQQPSSSNPLQYPDDNPRALQAFHQETQCFPPSSILTSPYEPPQPSQLSGHQNPPQAMVNMPGVVYGINVELSHQQPPQH